MARKAKAAQDATPVENLPTKPPEATEYVALALSEVTVNTDENCRQREENPEEWAAFVNNIRTQGLQQPPGVQYRKRGRGGAYHLVFGFRRYAALTEIHGTDAVVTFVVVKGNKADARLVNLLENMARRDLAPFELADSLHWQKRHAGMTTTDLAEKVGIVPNYVDTLVRLREKLHPDLWQRFVEYGAKPPIATFIKCVSKEDQVGTWESIMAEKEARKAAKQAAKEARERGESIPGSASKPGGDGAASKPGGDGQSLARERSEAIAAGTVEEEPEPGMAPAFVEPVEDFDVKCTRLLEDANAADDESGEFAAGVIAAVAWLRGEGGYPFE